MISQQPELRYRVPEKAQLLEPGTDFLVVLVPGTALLGFPVPGTAVLVSKRGSDII